MRRLRITVLPGERTGKIWPSAMMTTPVRIQAFQGQLLVSWILDRFATLSTHLQTEEREPWNDMVLQGYILAASYRQVFEALTSQTEHGRDEDLAANSCVVKFETLQAAAEGVDHVQKELIEGIIPRLSGNRAIGTWDVGSCRWGCGRWLKETEGEVFPRGRIGAQELS
jgi:hypothetical protein